MMVPSKSLLTTAFAGLALAGIAGAQSHDSGMNPANQRMGNMPFKYRGHATYNAVTGELKRGTQNQKAAALAACYTDTDSTGFFGVGALSLKADEWLDWGIVGGTSGTKCALDSNILGSFTYSYATLVRDANSGGPGAALGVNLYSGATGTVSDSTSVALYQACFSGLPGHNGNTAFGSGWFITVSLTGGAEVVMPNGAFGYGQQQPDTDSTGFGWAPTGPINVQAGDGTGGPDCNGNIDNFAIWEPNLQTPGGFNGNTWGFGASDHAAWYIVLNKADFANGTQATIAGSNPGGTNPSSFSAAGFDLAFNGNDSGPNSGEPVYGGKVTYTVAGTSTGHNLSTLLGYLGPPTPPVTTLGGGQVLLMDLSGPEILQIGVVPGDLTIPGLPVPIDLSFCGLTLDLQGVHLGGVRPFALSNGNRVTAGG